MTKWLTEDEIEKFHIDNPDAFDLPENFENCADAHPEGLMGCWCGVDDNESRTKLQSCPKFEYEQLEKEDVSIMCNHVWAYGYYGVCELKPINR